MSTKQQDKQQAARPLVVTMSELGPWTGNAAKPTLWRWIACRDFPAPVPLSPGRNGWLVEELDQWLAGRVAAREDKLKERAEIEAKKAAREARREAVLAEKAAEKAARIAAREAKRTEKETKVARKARREVTA